MNILNPELLLENVGGDRELLADIVSLFFDSSEGLVRDLRTAVAQADSDALHETAHQLKGALANVGAEAATRAAADLEQIGRRGSMTGMEDALSALEQEMTRLAPALRDLAGSGS
ncbi:MAG: Hpt domain-containing protein [Gemmatimonadetes bacterium]|nr:Hpt domain-containing protein [Gemmatimonadota bacterium]